MMSKLAVTFSMVAFSIGMITAPANASNPKGDAQKDDAQVVAAALMSGDYVGAESRIAGVKDNSDPVMLINLGNAYAGMGRKADAQIAYRAALSAEDIDLDMADGSVRSSRDVARLAMQRLGTDYAGR